MKDKIDTHKSGVAKKKNIRDFPNMEAVLDAWFIYFINLSFIKKLTRLCPRLHVVIIGIVFLDKHSEHNQKE